VAITIGAEMPSGSAISATASGPLPAIPSTQAALKAA